MSTLSIIPTSELLLELRRRSPIPPSVSEKMPPVVSATLDATAAAFDVAREDVLGPTRIEHIVKARFAAWLLLQDQGMTRGEIARAFGRQDVGTIRHGCLRGRAMVQHDKCFVRTLRAAYRLLQERLEKMEGTLPRPDGCSLFPTAIPA